jgi:hypothetical protein
MRGIAGQVFPDSRDRSQKDPRPLWQVFIQAPA